MMWEAQLKFQPHCKFFILYSHINISRNYKNLKTYFRKSTLIYNFEKIREGIANFKNFISDECVFIKYVNYNKSIATNFQLLTINQSIQMCF